MKTIYLLLAMSLLFYVTKNMALSYIFGLLSILFFYRSTEHFNLEPIQDNSVKHVSNEKKNVNKI